ncbi:MAG: transposase [Lachnospiraceae bacterium]|nr:transposase [Lachnospiraceae bacterium]
MTKEEKQARVPLWEKALLTLEEASAYTGIGINNLRKISEDYDCKFVLWVGKKRLFKREKLLEYLEHTFSV